MFLPEFAPTKSDSKERECISNICSKLCQQSHVHIIITGVCFIVTGQVLTNEENLAVDADWEPHLLVYKEVSALNQPHICICVQCGKCIAHQTA